MLLTELEEHTVENEKEKGGSIEISFLNEIDYSNRRGCYVLKSTEEPLDGKYYLIDAKHIFYYKNGNWHRDDNLPAAIFEDGSMLFSVNGKIHRTDGPAYINHDENEYTWWINGYQIDDEVMNQWLTENNIPLDWNTWSDLDKFYFALYWSNYKG